MPDYSKGKIYKLCSNQTDNVYIGSTTQELDKRLNGHKSDYKKYLDKTQHYISSIEIVKYDDVYIELIEEYPCESKKELEKQEGQIIKNTTNCINNRIAGRTKNEYNTDNKTIIKEKNSEYYQQNKDKINIQQKLYQEQNKDKIKEYSKNYRKNNDIKIKESKKIYRQENKEKIYEKDKKYREENPDKYKEIKKRYKTKIVICECGIELKQGSLSEHKNTTKHLDRMKN